MPSSLSRRGFLVSASGTALGFALLEGGAGPAAAADAFDALRAAWSRIILGSGFTASAAPFAAALSTLGADASGYRSTMAAASGSLWPDLPFSTSANVTGSLTRLKTMAQAYSQPGTGLTGDASLAADILSGLDHVVGGVYNTSTTSYGNWWDWQIGSPQALLDICTLMYGGMSAVEVSAATAAVDHFVPDSAAASNTGANAVDICRVLAVRGIIGKSSAKLATARDGLSPVFLPVTTGDGFYADGSFIQHTDSPYTGSYGAVLLGGLARLFALLAGSSWAVTDPNRQNVLNAVERSYAPFLYNGLMMNSVCGRAIARPQTPPVATTYGLQGGDHGIGHGIMASIALLGQGASAAENARWRGLVQGWIHRDYYSPPLQDAALDIPTLALLQGVASDGSVTATAEPVGHKLFASMDRAVHRRPGWAASVSMCSSRITYYETGNGENLHGWHTAEGMLQWWGDTYGNGQYTDAFWPTVDPYRLPGTTISKIALADAAGGAWGAPKPAAHWVGGATDGTYAALGQYINGFQSTLYAKKSWFCLDDSVVVLDGAVACKDAATVETVIDNRNLGANGVQTFTVNGVAQPTTQGWTSTFTGASWAQIAGHGAYVFPGGATFTALRENRTGTWSAIETGADTTPISRHYLTLWHDHGTAPANSSFSYILMPGATTTAAAARAAATGWMTVLANTADQQGIHVPSLGVTAVNFWNAGTVGPLTASNPASVFIRENGDGTATVCVSDPMRMQTSLTVTWNRAVKSVLSKPATVTGATTGSALTLTFGDLTGQAGATQLITVALG